MIDINTPSTITGIALLGLFIFLAISFIITGGAFWPLVAAVVVGGVTVYFGVKILKGIDRRVTHIFSGGPR